MKTVRLMKTLVAAATATALLTACGSDTAQTGSGGSGGSRGSGAPTAAGGGGGGDKSGDINGPCDVTDQATVASVFPGASAGKAGKLRNCEFTTAAGKVNIFFFKDLTIEAYRKQDTEQKIKTTDLTIGTGSFRDELGAIAIGKNGNTYGVQVLPSSGLNNISKYDAQAQALAKKIYDKL